ncbi:type IV secretion protein Rhs [Amycolatopsis sp. NBC_00348]|uniref:RHS repeat-associated core domain-containing protein n=1 Tax=Amycolatopsis sp. NBC_00348 TaxID=2975956 RepID=UPI002E26744E
MRRTWLRRGLTRGLAAVLFVTLAPAAGVPGVAAAAGGGPSVELPGTASTPVTADAVGTRPTDQATADALLGNQPAKPAQEGAGTPTATSLAPSATWEVAPHTGDFSWSYPLRVPPAPGGLAPSLALSYQSSTVDGRTSATNNQPSWVGEGWDLSPGFVERSYGGCADDTEGDVKPPVVGDLCWRSDNATAAYSGGGGMLIRDDDTGDWRTRSDDGSRVERLDGAGNSDDNGEFWKITALDGTQYFFGSQPDAKSTWTVPVFGDDAGEPCHGGSFATSQCAQAWRWNLDKIVDRNGNVVRYFYEPEANSYGLNGKDTAVSYIRGGTLARVDYGLREDSAVAPSGRVVFATADRCVPGSTCSRDDKNNWPDVFWDGECATPTCKDQHAPSFYSTKRLSTITTQVLGGTVPVDVDRWTLDQQYPDPGDGEKAVLWLKAITHTGLVGGQSTLPPVTFEGTKFANRVDTIEDGISPLVRYRLTGVVSEAGGVTSVTYSPECAAGGPLPDKDHPETNTLRCFPVRWAKRNYEERTDFFHKYVVTEVTQSDRLSSSTQQSTRYEYLDGAAWHWDTSEFGKEDKKTWNEFRGFGRVRTRSGSPSDPAGPVSMTEQRFYRGMDGDRKPGGGTRGAKVKDSEGVERDDKDWLRGFGFEASSFERAVPSDQPDPPRLTKTITDPDWKGPTATRGEYQAYIVFAGTQRLFTALASGGTLTTKTVTTYDDHGLPLKSADLGDVTRTDDDQCTTTEYERKPAKWLMNLPSRVQVDTVGCGQTAQYPRDAVSDVVTTYDGNGNATSVKTAKERPATGPVYVTTTNEYDVHGRVIAATDGLGDKTKTAYTPAVGGPVTQVASTSPGIAAAPAGLVTTKALHPAWGLPTLVTDPNLRKTETTYDPLGRQAGVWLPQRARAGNPKPSYAFTYQIRNDALTAVTTTKIGPKGNEISGVALLDGLLRPRQAQAPAQGGGRLLTDTRYDSQGRVWKTTQPYFQDGPVDTTLWIAADAAVPGLTRTEYDGIGRTVASIYYGGATERRRTTKKYGGDRVDTVPPAGGTATTSINDARGRTIELRHYTTPAPSASYETTRYTYHPSGPLATLTSPAGAVWRYTYDLLGRQVRAEDPDVGATTKTYDDADQLTTTRDALGVTIAHAYDSLGRETGTFLDRIGGTKLTEMTYDTVKLGKGRIASATRWVGGRAYRNDVLGYHPSYQPTGTSVTIPAEEGLLAGTYNSYVGYNPDGSVSSETYPAVRDLPSETATYSYNDLGLPSTSTGEAGGATVEHVSATSYTRYGEVQRMQLGSGTGHVWLSSYYDSNTRRLTRSIVDAEVPSPMQSDVRYTYSPAGSITSVADKSAAADVQCFRQDELQRLTEAWTPAAQTWSETAGCQGEPSVAGLSGPAPYWHSYSYDAAGDRRAEVQHTASGTTTRDYTYETPGHAHALSSVATRGPGVAGVEQFGYDAVGNTKSRKTAGAETTMTWDEEGHLAASTAADGKQTSFGYDAGDGRLIRRDPDATTLYLGNQEVRVNRSGGNPIVTRYYTFGGKTIATRVDTGPLTWLAADHQGTGQIAIDSGQNVTRRRQLPFGGPRGTSAAWPGDRGFVGGTTDASTGLTHLGAREYDPSTGRFASVDPVLAMADPQQMNGYAYSGNSPVTYSDPSGLTRTMCPDGECAGGGWAPNTSPASTYNPPVSWIPPSIAAPANPGLTLPKNKLFIGPIAKDKGPRPTIGCTPGKACGVIPSWQLTPDSCKSKGGLFDTSGISAACGADKAVQAEAKKAATPPGHGPNINLIEEFFRPIREAYEWKEEMKEKFFDHFTIADCFTGAAGAAAVASVEVCHGIDKYGDGVSASGKIAMSPSVGVRATYGLKIAEGTVEDLGGTGWAVSIPLGAGSIDFGAGDSGKWWGGVGVGIGAMPMFGKLGGLDASAGLEYADSWRLSDSRKPK